MSELVQIPKCPLCGSSDATRNGYTQDGFPRFKCRTCGKKYQTRYSQRFHVRHSKSIKLPHITKPHIPHDSYGLDCLLVREFPNVNALIGVPCFGCEFSERIGSCDPETCAKLDNWLKAPNILQKEGD
jgi:hypothetical protein